MYANWKKSLLWALALTVVLSTAGAVLAAKGGGKGKPGGEDPPPPSDPPPVLYELRLFSMPGDYAGGSAWPQEMNDLGEVVGYYALAGGTNQPFYIDAASTAPVVTNLNDLELDLSWSVPAGYYIYAAVGINNSGDIVGALASSIDPAVLRGFVLELRPDPLDTSFKPRLHLIPDEAWSHTYTRRINDAGEILGRGDDATSYIYRPGLHGLAGDTEVQILPFPFDAWYACFNNPTADHGTQIVTFAGGEDPVRYTLGAGTLETLAIGINVQDVRGLSDSGSFCGFQSIQVKRNRFEQFGYWYNGAVHDLPEVRFAQDINADDDVVGDSLLYHARLGALDLGEIVVAANEFEQQLWIDGKGGANLLTERGIVGTDPSDPLAEFPAMAGRLQRFDMGINWFYDVFVLLPLATP